MAAFIVSNKWSGFNKYKNEVIHISWTFPLL